MKEFIDCCSHRWHEHLRVGDNSRRNLVEPSQVGACNWWSVVQGNHVLLDPFEPCSVRLSETLCGRKLIMSESQTVDLSVAWRRYPVAVTWVDGILLRTVKKVHCTCRACAQEFIRSLESISLSRMCQTLMSRLHLELISCLVRMQ